MIIAFGYKKGVGKDTAGKFLDTILRCEHPDLRIKHISFAEKLKDICFQLYGWAGLRRGIYYETHRKDKEKMLPKLGCTPREMWIGFGNKVREMRPDTWIDYALKGVKANIVIITDLRFRNEAQAIRDISGILIKINRPGMPQGTDPAEVDLDGWGPWDYIIENTGTLRDLNAYLTTLATLLGVK